MRFSSFGRGRQQIWVIQGWELDGWAAAAEDLNARVSGRAPCRKEVRHGPTQVRTARDDHRILPLCMNPSVEGFRSGGGAADGFVRRDARTTPAKYNQRSVCTLLLPVKCEHCHRSCGKHRHQYKFIWCLCAPVTRFC